MSNYTTLEALKSFGGFVSDSDDVVLETLIGAASKAIENHCHRIFVSDEETDHTFTQRREGPDQFDGNTLYLDEDLAAVPSAITDSPTVAYLPENSTPYYAIILTEGSWAYPTVTITGHWAYSLTPPPDVELACLVLSKWMYDMKETTSGVAVVVTPEGQVLLPRGLPEDVKTLLDPYRRVRVAG